MSYTPALEPPGPVSPRARWYLFQDGKIVLDSRFDPPEWSAEEATDALGASAGRAHYLGRQGSVDCFAAEIEPSAGLAAGLAAAAFREAVSLKDEEFFRVASQASQLLTWASQHRFCGRCGAATEPAPGERATRCPSCGLLSFPRVSPAVIVTVLRGEEILLARSHRFASRMYSVLAGFVEAGESLEECAHREILEETAVEVEGLRYFGSQSWPFPHSLMVAFIARYRAGEIRVDPKELSDARWFTRDNLPELPLKASIARRMIDWYRAGAKEG
jgi:NAD+ diphosphatase